MSERNSIDMDNYVPDPHAHGGLYDEIPPPPVGTSFEEQIANDHIMPTADEVIPLFIDIYDHDEAKLDPPPKTKRK